jgi:hypothetical protein
MNYLTIIALAALSTIVVPGTALAGVATPAATSTSVLAKSAQDLTHPGATR